MTRKWNVVAVVLAAMVLASISPAQTDGQDVPQARRRPAVQAAPAQPGAQDTTNLRETMQQQRVQALRQEMEELRTQHDTLIRQLRAIHATAAKEKATETASQIERLIRERQEAHRTRISDLEQQQQRLIGAMRQRADRPERAARRGRRAPDVEFKSFDGRTYKLSDLEGRIVVLEWFNMECPFSLYHYATKPTMVELANKYKDKEVVWLAVNSTNHTKPETNLAFIKEHKLPFPIIDDRSGQIGRAFGARTTPHMFVIDRDGVIVYQGAIDNAPMGKVEADVASVNYVDQALSELLAGQPVSTPTTPAYGCTVKYASQ